MFPLASQGIWGELWTGVSETEGLETLFAGFRILMGN
jgi:hypothetical protein